MVLGFLAGQTVDKWISPALFRTMVLILLVALGVRLMF
jgi:uncharacterized membrane protein YfcA